MYFHVSDTYIMIWHAITFLFAYANYHAVYNFFFVGRFITINRQRIYTTMYTRAEMRHEKYTLIKTREKRR